MSICEWFADCKKLPPLSLPDERGLADAGQLDDLRVGMVFKQDHCMVKLLGVELRRAALTEIRVGRARDRLALLRALHDHVALELGERQQHVAQQRVHRVVGQDAEIQYVDGDALVDHLGDEAGRLRHRPREAVELGHDEHIAFSQLRPQPVELRALDLRAGEGVRVDFFRARRRQRRLLRIQTVAVARLRFGRDSRVAEYHVNSPVFPVLTPRVLNICFDTYIITYDAEFCNRWRNLKVLRQARIISSNYTRIFLYRLQQPARQVFNLDAVVIPEREPAVGQHDLFAVVPNPDHQPQFAFEPLYVLCIISTQILY